jgi:penicillin-binding protein 2
VVTVLVEHGLHGGSASAPIAAKILNRYFEDKNKEQQGGAPEQKGLSGSKVLLSKEMIEDTDAPPDDMEDGVETSPQQIEPLN